MGCCGPQQLCAFFSFCRQVESSRARAEGQAAAVLLESILKGTSFRDAGALPGDVLRRAVAVDDTTLSAGTCRPPLTNMRTCVYDVSENICGVQYGRMRVTSIGVLGRYPGDPLG